MTSVTFPMYHCCFQCFPALNEQAEGLNCHSKGIHNIWIVMSGQAMVQNNVTFFCIGLFYFDLYWPTDLIGFGFALPEIQYLSTPCPTDEIGQLRTANRSSFLSISEVLITQFYWCINYICYPTLRLLWTLKCRGTNILSENYQWLPMIPKSKLDNYCLLLWCVECFWCGKLQCFEIFEYE